jgi:uncharacterized membrane protein
MQEWLNLFVRWVHVIAGVMWIGQTYLFNWMERALTPPTDPKKTNISGELWMVHGGGFYLVEKQKWPELMPKVLHWFKWEAASTWISGMILLAVVYWTGAPLLDYGSSLSQAQGVGISIGVLVLGWLVYDTLWNSPIGKNEKLGAAISWVLVVALAWELGHFLSNRAVYLHIGAMFGTIMVANVWMRILPNQRKMIALTKAGLPHDPSLAARSRRCSKHNTFMSVPLIFTMISNHFPNATYGRDYNWAILGGLILLGWGGAKVIRDYL